MSPETHTLAEHELPAPPALQALLAASGSLRRWRQEPLLRELLIEAERETRRALDALIAGRSLH